MNLLTSQEIENFKKDGAIVLRNKFDVSWIEKLKKGIKRSHTKDKIQGTGTQAGATRLKFFIKYIITQAVPHRMLFNVGKSQTQTGVLVCCRY